MFIHTVCTAFHEAKIPYAVAGGYAALFHGVCGGTFDIDFAIKWSLENLKKLERVLKELGLVSRIPVDAESIFHFRDEYVNNRNITAWNFYHPIRLNEQVNIIMNYDLRNARIKTFHTASGDIKVLSKKDLIARNEISEPQVQYFSEEYLQRAKELTPDQVLQFLEDFSLLHSQVQEKCQLISMKIEPSLLRVFKMQCELLGIPYQKQIKKLMREWLEEPKT